LYIAIKYAIIKHPPKNGEGKGTVNEIAVFLFSENLLGYGKNVEVI